MKYGTKTLKKYRRVSSMKHFAVHLAAGIFGSFIGWQWGKAILWLGGVH